MKFVTAVFLIILLAFISGLYLPWWGIALVSFGVAALIGLKPGWAFLAGFAALFVLWGLLAAIADNRNNSLLSQKIAQVIPLGGSSLLLILVTGLVGALVGGVAALTGSFMVAAPKPVPDEPLSIVEP